MRLAARLLVFAIIAATGCASRGNVDLLEARLREQEDQLRSLHAQVDRTNSELTAAPAKRVAQAKSRAAGKSRGDVRIR